MRTVSVIGVSSTWPPHRELHSIRSARRMLRSFCYIVRTPVFALVNRGCAHSISLLFVYRGLPIQLVSYHTVRTKTHFVIKMVGSFGVIRGLIQGAHKSLKINYIPWPRGTKTVRKIFKGVPL